MVDFMCINVLVVEGASSNASACSSTGTASSSYVRKHAAEQQAAAAGFWRKHKQKILLHGDINPFYLDLNSAEQARLAP